MGVNIIDVLCETCGEEFRVLISNQVTSEVICDHKYKSNGKEYYFCSGECRTAFILNQNKKQRPKYRVIRKY